MAPDRTSASSLCASATSRATRGGRPCTCGGGSTNRVRGASTRRNGTVNSIFIIGLARPEVQRNGPRRSVITDFSHHGPHETAMTLFQGLPLGFRHLELLTCLLGAQSRSKLIQDRIFDQARRHRFGGTRTPSVLSGRLAYVIAIPPPRLGRVGGDHRPLATLAEEPAGEQSGLWRANRSCPGAATSTELGIDFLPHRRLDDRRMLARVHRIPVFDHAGIDGMGEQPT